MAKHHPAFGALPTLPGPRRPDPAERRRHEEGAAFLLRLEEAWTVALTGCWR